MAPVLLTGIGLGWIWGSGWTRLRASVGKLRRYYKRNRDTLTMLFSLSLIV